VTTKRNFYYNGKNLPIRIETTDRASHQLVSRVLRILLTEVVGHAKVELVQGDNAIDPTRSLDRFLLYVIWFHLCFDTLLSISGTFTVVVLLQLLGTAISRAWPRMCVF